MPASPPIHVVGESVADIVRSLDGGQATHAGGSAANVAYGLARLGREVWLSTQLGDDPQGALIRAHLEGVGVHVTNPVPPGVRTPSAIAVLDETGAAHYNLDVDWRMDPTVELQAGAHVHFGSFAMFLNRDRRAVSAALRAAQATTTTSVDPNIRPSLMESPDAIRSHFEDLLASADVVKASDEDIVWMYPGAAPVTVATSWLERGVSLAVVTMGAEGSVAVRAGEVIPVAPRRVPVVDTVGAGDSFMSALLDGLAGGGLLGPQGRTSLRSSTRSVLEAVLARAAVAAALTVGRAGAKPPDSAELRRATHDDERATTGH